MFAAGFVIAVMETFPVAIAQALWLSPCFFRGGFVLFLAGKVALFAFACQFRDCVVLRTDDIVDVLIALLRTGYCRKVGVVELVDAEFILCLLWSTLASFSVIGDNGLTNSGAVVLKVDVCRKQANRNDRL